jgi:type I restriction enzyme S subunit
MIELHTKRTRPERDSSSSPATSTIDDEKKFVAASLATTARNRTPSARKLEAIHVPIPAYEKQQEFSSLQGKVAAIRRAHTDNQPELDALQPAVLDKAFKGEL